MRHTPEPAHGVVTGTGPLPMEWNPHNVRFDIYDFNPEDEPRGDIIAWLTPYEFWDGWELWLPHTDARGGIKVATYFCQRLSETMGEVTGYLLRAGIIEDF